jgi:hypothetical protein
MDAPFIFNNVYIPGKKRFVLSLGRYQYLANLFAVFKKGTCIFVLIIISGIIRDGGNKSTWIKTGTDLHIIIIHGIKLWCSQAIAITFAAYPGGMNFYFSIIRFAY